MSPLSLPSSPSSPILFPDYDSAFSPRPMRRNSAQGAFHVTPNGQENAQKPTDEVAQSIAAPAPTSLPGKKCPKKKPEDDDDEYFPPFKSNVMLMEVHKAWTSTMDYGFGVVGCTPATTANATTNLTLETKESPKTDDAVDGRPLVRHPSAPKGEVQTGNADGAWCKKNRPLRFRTAAYRATVGAAMLKLQGVRLNRAVAALEKGSSVEKKGGGKTRDKERRSEDEDRAAKRDYSRWAAQTTMEWINRYTERYLPN